jgi:hypothetical protein
MNRHKRRKAERQANKFRKQYEEIKADPLNNGYFVRMKYKENWYYAHPKGDSYEFFPNKVGASVFPKESANLLASVQKFHCEVISVNDVNKEDEV